MAWESDMVWRCSAGETFDGIALKVYGGEKYAFHLMRANPALCTRLVFTGGERLQAPVVVVTEAEATAAAIAPWRE